MSAAAAAARAQQRAEEQERDRLVARWRELKPENDRCFCGSTEDLRRLVADLEAQHSHRLGQRPGRAAALQRAAQEQEHEQPEQEIEDEEIEP